MWRHGFRGETRPVDSLSRPRKTPSLLGQWSAGAALLTREKKESILQGSHGDPSEIVSPAGAPMGWNQ